MAKTTRTTTKRDVKVSQSIDYRALGIDYEKLQKELDKTKYIQSEIAKQDLSGKMPYCKNCAFQRCNLERTRNTCHLDRQMVVEYQVCARNKVRNDYERV